jgi:hypothetical protein
MKGWDRYRYDHNLIVGSAGATEGLFVTSTFGLPPATFQHYSDCALSNQCPYYISNEKLLVTA